MSHLTRCNFCTLESLHKLAATRGHTLTLRPAPFHAWVDGVNVYIHPPDYTPPDDFRPQTPGSLGEWWASWLASVPTHCCCNDD